MRSLGTKWRRFGLILTALCLPTLGNAEDVDDSQLSEIPGGQDHCTERRQNQKRCYPSFSTAGVGRPFTFVAALITSGTMLSSAPTDMDDVLHLVIELIAMVSILWTAWRWPEEEAAATSFSRA